LGGVKIALSIDEESLAQAFISAREVDASLGEQQSASVALAGAAAQAAPLTTNFIEKTLTRADGQPISNITHMEFGPDGLLYASSLTGTIYAYNIQKTLDGNYVATVVHQIDLLSQIPNHNDDGTLVPQVQGRYVLGFDVVGQHQTRSSMSPQTIRASIPSPIRTPGSCRCCGWMPTAIGRRSI
jgi:hypothetical protein